MLHHRTEIGGLSRSEKPSGQWWCSFCAMLVIAEKNPVLCEECGGDMTIAPRRVVGGGK